MASRITDLRNSGPSVVAAMLDSVDQGPFTNNELRAALANALERIEKLERAIDRLTYQDTKPALVQP